MHCLVAISQFIENVAYSGDVQPFPYKGKKGRIILKFFHHHDLNIVKMSEKAGITGASYGANCSVLTLILQFTIFGEQQDSRGRIKLFLAMAGMEEISAR